MKRIKLGQQSPEQEKAATAENPVLQGAGAEGEEQIWVSRKEAKAIKTENRWKKKESRRRILAMAEQEWEEAHRNLQGLPTSRARPAWLNKVSCTHRLYERGGIFLCGKCGALGAFKPQKLFADCEGRSDSNTVAKMLMQKGRLPKGYQEWPNRWAKDSPPPLFKVNFG